MKQTEIKTIVKAMLRFGVWLFPLFRIFHVNNVSDLKKQKDDLEYYIQYIADTPDWASMAINTLVTSIKSIDGGANAQAVLSSMRDVILDDIANEILEGMQ